MPYKQKRKQGKRSKPQSHKLKMTRQIQMADMKPPTALVRFQGKMKYQCLLQTGANNKSILRVPASYIDTPTVETGVWTPDSSARFIDTTANFFGKYAHYKVVGSRITVTVKSLLADGAQQLNNMVCLARVTNTNTYSTATPLAELEGDYAVKTRQWGGFSNTGYRQARLSMGYSPKKQLGLKDIEDNGVIKVQSSYGASASDNTFFNVIICGELDAVSQGHSSALVEVKQSLLVRFEEPLSTENAPTLA